MQTWILFLLPVIAAVIGYATNYVAVKMLFHPRNKVKILFFEIQGIFPKRQEALGQRLGEVVARELVSVDDVTSKVKDAARSESVIDAIDEHLEKVIRNKLPEMFPMLAMFLNDELIAKVKSAFRDEILDMTDHFTNKMSEDLKQNLDIEGIVREKVSNFSSDKLEAILFEIMKKEFRFIEIIGGVLGFVIGVIQVALVYWSSASNV